MPSPARSSQIPRPRPHPRPRPLPGPAAGLEAVRAPGLVALLRRNPRIVQRSAVGSIVVGAALFVIASLTTPLAAADTARPPQDAQAVPGLSETVPDSSPLLISGTATAATVSKKKIKAKPAPTSTAVIAGLASNGIPNVALNAYRVAAARMANIEPGCGIDWALLAGIGREESDHGRFGNATLNANGTSTPRIIGPALTGQGNEYIAAPPNGMALDGDAKYTHALGPMQFIPQTWAGYGADANGDGHADIFNINDAALGAARYLCAAGGDLRTHDGQVRAVLTYNHSTQYLAQVLALADAYRRGIAITGIPIGNTTGALAPVDSMGTLPPANPGAPTAVDNRAPTKAAPPAKPAATKATIVKPTKAATSKPSPAPSGGTPVKTPSPAPSGTSAAPAPSGSPSPGPTTSCDPLSHLLGKC